MPDIQQTTDNLTALLTYDSAQPLFFNTGLFLFLFLAFLAGYCLLSGKRTESVRLFYLTAFSYYFYYKNAGDYCALLAGITLLMWQIALWMDRARSQGVKRAWVVIAVTLMLGQLAYFKYTNFALSLLVPLWGDTFQPLDIFLPAGISFFTFQSMNYIIDVYRGKMRATTSLLDFAFFVSFFPTLLAGPILRAKDFLPQLRGKSLCVTREMFGMGLWFVMMGLFKKAVISDYIGENFVNRIFDDPSLYTGIENLMGIYGYALKLYCDFSGYSDMAIGIALLLGFHFPDNFRSPYQSASVTEFWRRWHISLSSWLRDYLYISLGGNRKGKFRTYLNLIVTMLLGGLWHGASLNFVVWGGLHGVALAVHKGLRALLHRPKDYCSRGWRRAGAVVLTFHFVCFCWIFFRNATFEASLTMLRQILTAFHPELFTQLATGYWQVFVLMAAGYLLHACPDRWQEAGSRIVARCPLPVQALLLLVVIYVVIQVKSSDIQPFIYFQF